MSAEPPAPRRRRWLPWSIIALCLLVAAGAWYIRFRLPCDPDDLCVREPSSDSEDPFVGVYKARLDQGPRGQYHPGWVVVLYEDGSFCWRDGDEHAQQGSWSIRRASGFPLHGGPEIWQRWDIDFSVFKSCAPVSGPSAKGPTSFMANIVGTVHPDGSVHDLGIEFRGEWGVRQALRRVE